MVSALPLAQSLLSHQQNIFNKTKTQKESNQIINIKSLWDWRSVCSYEGNKRGGRFRKKDREVLIIEKELMALNIMNLLAFTDCEVVEEA